MESAGFFEAELPGEIFQKIFTDLAADADMQDISIDSTCIKAHKASAGAKKEKS